MTNSVFMRDELSLRRDKSHVNQPLVEGRCRDAAFYPHQLVEAILQGMATTADHDTKVVASVMGWRAMEEERHDTIRSVTKAASTVPNADDDKPVPYLPLRRLPAECFLLPTIQFNSRQGTSTSTPEKCSTLT